jgi:hypothetical protein
MRRILSGERLARREPKVAYNGAEGVPIREEIVAHYGSAILTRNSYGSICLNRPDVLIADIDLGETPPLLAGCGAGFAMLLTAALLGWMDSTARFVIATIGALNGGFVFVNLLHRGLLFVTGGLAQRALRRVERFVAQHEDWRVRVYRTPSGFRLLALHRLFDPAEPAVAKFFRVTRTDPLYVRMCRKQRGFRARLTAKPWRMGLKDHLRPRPGVWPVRPERMGERRVWLARYDRKAEAHAACEYIMEIGAGGVHPNALVIQQLHDDQSRANSSLPLA